MISPTLSENYQKRYLTPVVKMTTSWVSKRPQRFLKPLRSGVTSGKLVTGSNCDLSQERVRPRSDLGMAPQQQVPSGRQGHELGGGDVLGGVLAKAERV